MTTTSVKVSELTSAALRYAVAAAAGYEVKEHKRGYALHGSEGVEAIIKTRSGMCVLPDWEPDLDWSQLGPLIEAHWMAICNWMESYWGVFSWHVFLTMKGENMKVWFCRAIAASHWGEYADIPSELVQEQSDG